MEIVIVIAGIIGCIILGFVAFHLFADRRQPILAAITGILAVLVLLGGFYLANEQFTNDCESAGGYVLGGSCYGFSEVELEIEDDD